MIPYSAEVFFAILAEYNLSVWPAQLVALILGLAAVGLIVWAPQRARLFVTLVLVAAWGWTGVVYHLGEFAAIDFWAYGFSAVFVLQGLLLSWAGLIRGRLRFEAGRDAVSMTGAAVMVLALVAHPLLALALGRDLTEAAYMGVAPGPCVVFTLGVLVTARPAAPLYLFVLPLCWCVIAGAVAVQLGIYEDIVLVAAGLLAMGARIAGRSRQT